MIHVMRPTLRYEIHEIHKGKSILIAAFWARADASEWIREREKIFSPPAWEYKVIDLDTITKEGVK